ncbi:MAG: RimK/LysX family protein [Myxococcales bacterium]
MSELRTIGWREWVALPELDISRIKAKVDTGARSSSLHAYDIEVFSRGRRDYVRFVVHPVQRETRTTLHCVAELHEHRHVKSSSGHREYRPIIRTLVELDGKRWPIDLTLTTRDSMGFRMLLGREAIRGRFLVNPGRSYLCRDLVPRRKKGRER